MRRTSFFAGLAILAIAVSLANAQGGVIFHGIPASVTSGTAQNPTPGIPASVTSPTVDPRFNRPIFITSSPQSTFHHHNHFVPVPVPVPVYYPFYSYPVTYGDDTQQQPQPEPVVEVVETPAPTIFENRPGYKVPPIQPSYTPPPANNQPSSESSAPDQASNNKSNKQDVSATEPEPTTILVFRDGHQLEIGNYAIVGDTLYNLAGNYKTHKILLADLDLDKTAKVNEERGYDFRLPKQQGN